MDASSEAGWEQRLRSALAGSNEDKPRALCDLELPLHMDKLLTSEWLLTLREAAVLVPIVRRDGGPTVLLTRRSDLLRNHTGQIAFPGGRRDAGDISAADNALRESEEEIGLPRSHVEIVGYLDDYPTGTRYRITPVVGIIDVLPELSMEQGEVAEIFEVPLSLLLDPARYERKSFLVENVRAPFFEVNYGDYRIWGATAGMLRNLCQKVNA